MTRTATHEQIDHTFRLLRRMMHAADGPCALTDSRPPESFASRPGHRSGSLRLKRCPSKQLTVASAVNSCSRSGWVIAIESPDSSSTASALRRLPRRLSATWVQAACSVASQASHCAVRLQADSQRIRRLRGASSISIRACAVSNLAHASRSIALGVATGEQRE